MLILPQQKVYQPRYLDTTNLNIDLIIETENDEQLTLLYKLRDKWAFEIF